MIEKLTKKQEALIPKVRQELLDRMYNYQGERDKKEVEKGINKIYEFCGYKKPTIFYMDSPMGMQYAYHVIKHEGANIGANIRANIGDNIRANIRDNIRANIRDNIRDNIRANILANIRDNIRDNIGANIRANIRDNIRANIRDNIRDDIGANIGANIRANIRDNIGANIRANIRDDIGANIGANIRANIRDNIGDIEYQYMGNSGSIWDWYWIAFYDYFIQAGISLGEKESEFKWLLEFTKSGVYDILYYNGLAIVCPLPSKCGIDEKQRLHSADGYAVEWEDGYGQHYLHGVYFSDEDFKKFKKISGLELLTRKNQDQKRAMLMEYENKKLLTETKAKVINEMTDDDNNPMRLYEIEDTTVDINDEDRYMVFYEAIDPAKNEKIVLQVPPSMRTETAFVAKLWTFPKMWEMYEKQKEVAFAREG